MPATATVTERTMQAIVNSKYGSPDRLELREIDKPALGDDSVPVCPRQHDEQQQHAQITRVLRHQ